MSGRVYIPQRQEANEDWSATTSATRLEEFPEEEFHRFSSGSVILSKDAGLVPFRPLGSQRYILDKIKAGISQGKCEFTILKARQLGVTTALLLLDLFWILRHRAMIGAFVLHSSKSLQQMRNAVKMLIANSGSVGEESEWRERRPIVTENRDYLLLRNQSMLTYLTAGLKEGGGSGLGRSGAFSFAHLSEVAFYGDPDDLNQFVNTLSQRHPQRLFIYESTANGFNHWKDMWDEAKTSAGKEAIFASWVLNELYRLDETDPLYKIYSPETATGTTSLSRYERTMSALVEKRYGITVTPGQIAWRRWMLAERMGGDESTMAQEMPWIEEEAFQSTGRQFFSHSALTQSRNRASKQPFKVYRYALGTDWFDTSLVPVSTVNAGNLRVWQEPAPGAFYALGLDPAYGSSDDAVNTCASMWRLYADRVEQVAEYVSDTISPASAAWVAAHLCGWYEQGAAKIDDDITGRKRFNRVLFVLEISGPGQSVHTELEMLRVRVNRRQGTDGAGFPHISKFIWRKPDSVTKGGMAWHIKASRDTNWLVRSTFKNELELGVAITNSVPLLDECATIAVIDGRVESQPGKTDDRFSAAALALYGWKACMQEMLIKRNMTFAQERQKASAPAIGLPQFLAARHFLSIDPGLAR